MQGMGNDCSTPIHLNLRGLNRVCVFWWSNDGIETQRFAPRRVKIQDFRVCPGMSHTLLTVFCGVPSVSHPFRVDFDHWKNRNNIDGAVAHQTKFITLQLRLRYLWVFKKASQQMVPLGDVHEERSHRWNCWLFGIPPRLKYFEVMRCSANGAMIEGGGMEWIGNFTANAVCFRPPFGKKEKHRSKQTPAILWSAS